MESMKNKGYFDKGHTEYTEDCNFKVLYILNVLQSVAILFLVVANFTFYKKFKSFTVEQKRDREMSQLRSELPPRFVQPPNYAKA